MHPAVSIRSFAWLVLLAGPLCHAQEPYTLTAKAYEVKLVFSAADHLGHPVDDLTATDLLVLDDGKAQHDITHFESRTNLPLRAGIVIDTSRSMWGDVMKHNQQIARLFATKVLRSESDQAFLSEFDFAPTRLADWTNDSAVLERASTRLGHNGASRMGGTAIYDSVYRTIRDQFADQKQQPASETANLLLLFSDGDDNTSNAYLRDVVNLCQETQTRIYVFSANPKARFDDSERNLRDLASLTGGRIFYDEQPSTANFTH